MAEWQLPAELVLCLTHLSHPLHARLAWRLLPLVTGLLFAQGRRTVARWLRAAGLGDDYRAYYYGSSGFLVGDFHSFGSMQVRILRRRYSSSRKP